MSDEHVGDLAPELALGIASPEDSARALEHLRSCPECRRDVEELARTADALLLLAPAQQPPRGLEERVAKRLGRERPRRSPWRRAAALAAALAVGAAGALGGAYLAVRDDLQLGGYYRATLEEADGIAFVALPLRHDGGPRAGHVFVYEGRTPWVFALVDRGPESGTLDVEVELRDGRELRVGSLEVHRGRGALGSVLPVSVFDIARFRLVDPRGETAVLTAEVPAFED